jgi:hypothetical protein
MGYNAHITKEVYKSNYTSNIYDMFQLVLYQLKVRRLAKSYYEHWADFVKDKRENLYIFIQELKDPFYDRFTPDNNWGDRLGALQWLQNIYDNWKDGYNLDIEW